MRKDKLTTEDISTLSDTNVKRVDFHTPIIFGGAPRNRVSSSDAIITDVENAVLVKLKKGGLFKIPYGKIDYIELDA